MSECLPDLPRYIRQRGDEWQGADHQNGPWRPIPAPQSGLPWKTDGPAVQSREPASVAADARPLSPAAQAVLDAFRAVPDLRDCPSIAAALRAAADQVVPDHEVTPGGSKIRPSEAAFSIRREILAIAAELEGLNA